MLAVTLAWLAAVCFFVARLCGLGPRREKLARAGGACGALAGLLATLALSLWGAFVTRDGTLRDLRAQAHSEAYLSYGFWLVVAALAALLAAVPAFRTGRRPASFASAYALAHPDVLVVDASAVTPASSAHGERRLSSSRPAG